MMTLVANSRWPPTCRKLDKLGPPVKGFPLSSMGETNLPPVSMLGLGLHRAVALGYRDPPPSAPTTPSTRSATGPTSGS